MSEMSEMKLYRISDYEWWAGPSLGFVGLVVAGVVNAFRGDSDENEGED